MMITKQCRTCGDLILPDVNYGNYYSCKQHLWSDNQIICVECYKKGAVTCSTCGKDLRYHDRIAVSEKAAKSGMLF